MAKVFTGRKSKEGGGMKRNIFKGNNLLKKLILAIIVAVFCFTAVSLLYAEDKASFNCEKAKTWIEKLICKDGELIRLDREMSASYKVLISILSSSDKKEVRKNQIEWLKTRDKACDNIKIDDAARNYLSAYYSERITELNEWQQYLKNEGGKKENKPWKPKCWKRQQIMDADSASIGITGNDDVCRAFERVLNTTCESPEKLKCNWTLPQGEKHFQKLNWQTLAFNEYKGIVEELILGKDQKWRWNQKNPEVKKAFDEGKINIKVAAVDINNDGKIKHIVRENWKADCMARGTYGIIDTETKKLDWQYERTLSCVNALVEGAEIMLFDGRAYMFGWDGGYKIVQICEASSYKSCRINPLKRGEK